MPELPEIEVLRRSLEARLEGRIISGIRVRCRALREPISRRSLLARLGSRRILRLRRRAKYLLVDVEAGSTLVVHLGMSGRLTLVEGPAPAELHEHVVFELEGGGRLRFRDPRRFGLVLALATRGLEQDRHFAHLGLEPLARDFRGAALAARAVGRRAPVKNFLMDARVVVGVGNIYASEALYRAGVHPTRSVSRISTERWSRLADAIGWVLEDAIRQGGTTLNDYTDGVGEAGYFQVSLAVYGREGEPCRGCGAPVRRTVLAGRSTFYCPRCQR